jgi:predicted nucleic acid-binding protein
MSVLADSSTIFRALAVRKTVQVAGEFTLELARYELGNAILKEYRIFKTLTLDEADTLAASMEKLLDNMTIVSVPEAAEIIKVAVEASLSFYDASFLATAKKMGLTLSTEDERLLKAAKKFDVKTMRLEEYSPM